MSVVSIAPISGKEGKFGLYKDSRASRSWQVLTNNRFDDEYYVVQTGIGLGYFPVPYLSTHPDSFILLCRSVSAKQDERAPLKWIVTAEYSGEPISIPDQQSFVPPLQRPAVIRRRKNKYMKALDKDVDGDAIVNSAGDPFDPPPETPRGRPLITISKNVGFIPPGLSTYGDGINSLPFMCQGETFDQYTARIDDWDMSELKTETDPTGVPWQYYVFTWSFEIDTEEGWKGSLLDCGFRERRAGGDGISKFNILDQATPPNPVSSPALLDGNGYSLVSQGIVESADNAVYLPFDFYYETDFNQFPLF